MRGCNICFKGDIWKIIPKLPLLPLNWSNDFLFPPLETNSSSEGKLLFGRV